MKRITIPAVALAAGLAAGTAAASDGTITFQGVITAATCTVAVNGGTATASITLPTVSSSILAANTESAGDSAFTLELSDCDLDALTDVMPYFEVGPNVDLATGHLNNTGTATNVQVQLFYGQDASKVVRIGSLEQLADANANWLADDGTLTFGARYYAAGAVVPGSVVTSVTYSLVYR